jgi:hypothetical protein
MNATDFAPRTATAVFPPLNAALIAYSRYNGQNNKEFEILMT